MGRFFYNKFKWSSQHCFNKIENEEIINVGMKRDKQIFTGLFLRTTLVIFFVSSNKILKSLI
jgi:hypothetical protein